MEESSLNCDRIEADDLLEQYLRGALDEETRTAVEQHYFECERCSELLRTLEVMRTVLKEQPPSSILTAPHTGNRWFVPAALAATVPAADDRTGPGKRILKAGRVCRSDGARRRFRIPRAGCRHDSGARAETGSRRGRYAARAGGASRVGGRRSAGHAY